MRGTNIKEIICKAYKMGPETYQTQNTIRWFYYIKYKMLCVMHFKNYVLKYNYMYYKHYT